MPTSRRTVLKQLTAASAACGLARSAPAIATEPKTDSAHPLVGAGAHQYECNHNWAQLPAEFTWQTTHNVAVDGESLVYVIHEGRLDQPDHPAIFVFDADGKFVRAFGKEFQGGGHGLDIRREGSDEFLYVTAYKEKRSFAKLTPTGEIVWHKTAPMPTGRYRPGEDALEHPGGDWFGRDRFLPTNYAFHPEGGFFLADGYGAYCIHHYDADANYISTFGKPSDDADADATFDTPHGLWLDTRPPEPKASAPGAPHSKAPLIVVADRANARLQWFTLAGDHVRTQTGFLLPANCDTRGDLLLVPDLVGRVTLLGADNNVVAHLGDDSARIQAENGNYRIRRDPSRWNPGKFVHPHDACFDHQGNIYVAEWTDPGRITKLTKLT